MIGNSIAGFLGTGVAASTSSFESIATTNGNGSATTLSFTSIPSTFKHLQIRGISKDQTAGAAPALYMQFNSDTGSNYKSHYLQGSGVATSAGAAGGITYIYCGYPSPGNAASGTMGASIIDILDYTNTSKYTTARTLNGYDTNNAATGYVDIMSGVWLNTAAITRIDFNINGDPFTSDTTFALYGIKG